MNDPDIHAVRAIPPTMAEPTDESVSRTWHKLTRLTAAERSTRRPLPWAVPVTAAVVVAALTIGGVTLLRPSGGQDAGTTVVLPSPGATKEIEPNTDPASPETVTALNALATAAGGGTAVTINAGQLVFVRTDGTANSTSGQAETGGAVASPAVVTTEAEVREIWFDPQGAIPLKITDGVNDLNAGPKSNFAAEIAQARDDLATQGPSLIRPTPQWLAALPTDPTALLAQLRAESQQEGAAWSVDHRLWDTMANLYSGSEIALTPAVRAALLQALSGLHGLTTSTVTVNGHSLVAIRHTEKLSGDEILFDPASGKAVGRRTLYNNQVEYESTWVQSIVNGL
ncbi:hypothetical protein F4553_004578 [Allocatelliglobosispora scoriae]|uniref:CU044_5270 family protein n=1 Tax=Allocatelliglobosispora scoriae TaxID=643052 RepID=A0A841BVL6_9ACTN|nr:hypothetical protein [Allocatelliglobosispora scoriae]MBB5871199.1 hypothetical protein [Allocatelliglobosispora scoriae]